MRFIPFVGGVYRATPPTAGIQWVNHRRSGAEGRSSERGDCSHWYGSVPVCLSYACTGWQGGDIGFAQCRLLLSCIYLSRFQYQSSFGKRGEGPGESIYAANIRFAGQDTVWVLDDGKGRMYQYSGIAGGKTPKQERIFCWISACSVPLIWFEGCLYCCYPRLFRWEPFQLGFTLFRRIAS